MTDIFVRLACENDIIQSAAIEAESLDTAWSEASIRDSLANGNAVYAVAVYEKEVCGIGSMYCIAGEGQIMNIAVSEKYRRRGIAEKVMNFLNTEAVKRNCEIITLEVAEDNVSANSLYEKCGYIPVGRRKGFYGGIDAIIMEKRL